MSCDINATRRVFVLDHSRLSCLLNFQVIPLEEIHNTRKKANMEVSEETVQKIQAFAANRASAEKESTSQPLSATALHAYARRLDGTLHELQERVRRQEEELNKVCTNSIH